MQALTRPKVLLCGLSVLLVVVRAEAKTFVKSELDATTSQAGVRCNLILQNQVSRGLTAGNMALHSASDSSQRQALQRRGLQRQGLQRQGFNGLRSSGVAFLAAGSGPEISLIKGKGVGLY